MLLIDQRIDETGALVNTTLDVEDGALVIRVAGKALAPLAVDVVERVMRRYGKPLAEGVDPALDLDLGEGQRLGRLRHLARYDVIAKDFLVWSAPGAEPLAELATAVAAALVHLANAAAER